MPIIEHSHGIITDIYPAVAENWPELKIALPEGFIYAGEYREPVQNDWFLNSQAHAELKATEVLLGNRHILFTCCYICKSKLVTPNKLNFYEDDMLIKKLQLCFTCKDALRSLDFLALSNLQDNSDELG